MKIYDNLICTLPQTDMNCTHTKKYLYQILIYLQNKTKKNKIMKILYQEIKNNK